jgi:hypothetical protein
MLKRLLYMFSVAVFILLTATAHAATNQEVTVMTRNLYLGADLGPVITATTADEFFAAAQAALTQVAANNFPERAQAMATEIVEKRPHLVGLQEAYNFTFNGFNGPPPFRDHLEDLLFYLSALGADYRVAAVVKNLDIQAPIDLLGDFVARGDVDTTVVSIPTGLCIKPSLDGCNYQVVAGAVTPAGPITIERGFVAVDANVGGTLVRFVDTHLEERELVPSDLLVGKFFQAAQATELIAILTGLQNPDGSKLIVTGDINSAPTDPSIPFITPPYKQFADAGYVDAWTQRPGNSPGLTCCQAADLLNPESALIDRLDLTLFREMPSGKVKVNLVGNEETDKTPSGLWPSDHAGVVTRVEFAP